MTAMVNFLSDSMAWKLKKILQLIQYIVQMMYCKSSMKIPN